MRYCVDFQSPSSDWISYSGSYDSMADTSFTCSRGWVVIQSSDFAALDPSLASAASPFTPDQVKALQYVADNPPSLNLSLSDGALIASAVLGVWVTGAVVRSIIGVLSGGFSNEE